MAKFAHKLCANDQDAEDSLQHARLVIAKKLHSFREMAKITTWLYSVIKNECYRLQKKMFGFAFHEAPETELLSRAGAGDFFERRELQIALSEALSELDSDELEIILKKDVEGHSLDELAVDLNVTLEALKSRLHRARKKLKERLAAKNVMPPAGSL